MDIQKNKEFEEFLKYGITGSVSKKAIVEGNILRLFFTLVAMAVSQFSNIVCVIATLNLILVGILTYSRQEVTGKEIFWIHGIEATAFTVIFALIGTSSAMYVIDEKYYLALGSIIVVVYLIVIALYAGMIMYFIKKGAYSKAQKTNSRVFFMFFGVGGIAFARVFTKGMSNDTAWQCLSICSYFISLLSTIGIFNLIKYYYLKKLEL